MPQFNTSPMDMGYGQLPSWLSQAMQDQSDGYPNGKPEADGIPSYILQALKAQQAGPPAPQGPMDAAMAPPQPQGPLGQAMAPQAPQGYPQQQPQPQGRTDSNAIYDGLINGGAALIGGKNLKEGLAGGIAGFNDSYDARVAKDKADKAPKVIPLSDGAFTMLAFPDGTQKVVRNEEVANYITGQKQDATQAALAKIDYQARATAAATQGKEDRKIANDANEALQGTSALMDQYDHALDIVSKQGKGAQVAGAVPGISGFFGGDTASQNKFLSGLQVDARLAESAKLKGAISEKEQAMLKEPVPSLTDDRETVWKPWLEQRKAALQKVIDFQASQAARGSQAPAAAPQAPQRPSAASSGVQNIDAVAAEMRRRGLLK